MEPISDRPTFAARSRSLFGSLPLGRISLRPSFANGTSGATS
jgi:hypothetical protein